MMKNKLFAFIVLIGLSFINGCLVPEKISYTVKLETANSGIVTMQFYNVKSNAEYDDEFQEDKKNLFDYISKSDKLVTQLKGEGKDILSRELYVEDGILNGKAEYRFYNIKNVDGIIFEDGFYYLTLALDDSVLTTNGQIIVSKDYKRILWDKNIRTLKFEMYSTGFDDEDFKALSPFYNSK